jgi:hypothetical protein
MKDKEYSIPLEVARLIDAANGFDKAIGLYSKLPFGFKKVKEFSKLAEECRADFWRKLYEMYPEVKSLKGKLSFDSNTLTVKRIP